MLKSIIYCIVTLLVYGECLRFYIHLLDTLCNIHRFLLLKFAKASTRFY